MATSVVGNDGGITLPVGEDTGVHGGIINRWRARGSYVTSEVTGFSDVKNRRNRLGLLSVEGSASGVPNFNAVLTAPDAGPIALASSGPLPGGAPIILLVATGCTWTFTAVVHGFSLDSNKTGDAAQVFDFMSGDADDFAEAWDETA